MRRCTKSWIQHIFYPRLSWKQKKKGTRCDTYDQTNITERGEPNFLIPIWQIGFTLRLVGKNENIFKCVFLSIFIFLILDWNRAKLLRFLNFSPSKSSPQIMQERKKMYRRNQFMLFSSFERGDFTTENQQNYTQYQNNYSWHSDGSPIRQSCWRGSSLIKIKE